ncbi:MAG: ABC transporter substrate-binding protein [Pseudomonadota bacterium]
MIRLTVFVLALSLAACGKATLPEASESERPSRIVSLDFCADQYLLKFADREQILAVSPDAVRDFSFMREEAVGVPTVRSLAEDVILLKPDLVVRSYGGGPNAGAFFERAGIPVLQVGWASSIHGDDISSIPKITRDVAAGLGHSDRGEALVQSYQARLAQVQASASDRSTLYMTPSGVTSGGNSMIHEAMVAAGLRNFADRQGWHSLPLERLAYERPDLITAAFFGVRTNHQHGWSAARHPVAKRELSEADMIKLDSAWLSCGGWYVIEAIEALAEGAAEE